MKAMFVIWILCRLTVVGTSRSHSSLSSVDEEEYGEEVCNHATTISVSLLDANSGYHPVTHALHTRSH